MLTECDTRTLYGPGGWINAMGIDRLVLGRSMRAGQLFERFEGLGGATAKLVRSRLPSQALADSQNGAPTLGSLLQVAATHPDTVTLGGYLIGEGRWDERISVDTLTYRPATLDAARARTPQLLWRDVCTRLGLAASERPPDTVEIQRRPSDYAACWWMWWD